MFYELSNKNRMECERYQDCSWFQQDLMKESLNCKLLQAETAEPIIDFEDFDLAMPYSKENILKVQEYPNLYEDILSEENKKEEKIKNNNISADENLLFTNFKVEDDNLLNTYNVNYCIKKTDSFDNVEFISSTDPAEILPITLMECLSSLKSSQSINNIKNEPKEEIELYSPESSSYLMHSNDSDLNIGREETIEEVDLNESTDLIKNSVEFYSKQDGSYLMATSNENIKSDIISQDNVVLKKSLNSDLSKSNINSCLSSVFGENSNNLNESIKTESYFSNDSNVQLELEKNDLNLDLTKVNFEQAVSVNSPDLDFMDLVEYINKDDNINHESKSKSHSLKNYSNSKYILNKNTIQNKNVGATFGNNVNCNNYKNTTVAKNKDHEFKINNGVTEVSNSLPPKMLENIVQDSVSKIDNENISIAERIKTIAKRRSTKKYNIKNYDSSDEDDENYNSNDNKDEDEDYEYNKGSPKRKCTTLNKKLKSDILESSNSLRKLKDESETDSYRERRDKNNEASRRSRQNRKARERDMFKTLEEEERRNLRLKTESDVLEKQVTSLRQLLLQVVLHKAEAT